MKQFKPALFLRSAGTLIFGSFLCVIACGTFLLSLPIAQLQPFSVFDAFFLATSATCVTGLSTIPLTALSKVGWGIILVLIQIGGLSMVTLTIFFLSLIKDLGFETQQMAEQALELQAWRQTKQLLRFSVIFTLLIELVGSLLLFGVFSSTYHGLHAAGLALFHAISAFCNAGIVMPELSHTYLRSSPLLLTILALLVFLGGMGFMVWHEIFTNWRKRQEERHYHASLHMVVVLRMAFILTALTAAAIWYFERTQFSDLSPLGQWANIIFNAVSYHSAGFSTLVIASLKPAMLFVCMLMAFIGSAPGSTGSGIKTTTLALIIASIASVMRGSAVVEMARRRIPPDLVLKAMALSATSCLIIGSALFTLLSFFPDRASSNLITEVISAFTNLGIDSGITSSLDILSGTIIALTMVLGRVGPLTLIIMFRRRQDRVQFSYPHERISLG